MKLIVLGGCADMARPLLAALREDARISAVLLADINEERARQMANDLGRKFTAARCDATDREQVVSLMRGNDLAACYVGPFYRFEKSLAACALEAQLHYISIADDYDAYLDVLSLEDEARKANLKIMTGFGNSPGITQVLAAKGYRAMAHPERIHVSWCAGAGEQVGATNLMHLFHIFNSTTLQWRNGAEVRVSTGSGRKRVIFPQPIGAAWVYYTGHAESVSLPRNLPGLLEVTLHGGVKPHYIVSLLKLMRGLGMFNTHAKRALLARCVHHIETWFPARGLDKSVGRVDIFGQEEGGERCLSYAYVGHIAEITSMPLYLAATWLLEGRFDAMPGGVYAPEKLIQDPHAFLAGLQALGLEIQLEAGAHQ